MKATICQMYSSCILLPHAGIPLAFIPCLMTQKRS